MNRLTIDKVELTPSGILIKQMSVIEHETGKAIRILNLNKELVNFLACLEIGMDTFFNYREMSRKNPAFKQFINTFNLTLEGSE